MAVERISGFDLAEYLYSKGGVLALVKYAGKSETDWLELKAGMCLQPEDIKKNETPKDLYWNYAREIIALMNTSGGVLIIGIQDQTLQYVPLEDNDPKHLFGSGPEVYIREFVKPSLWPRELTWTSHGKVQELSNKQLPSDTLAWRHAPYTDSNGRTGEVVLIFVKPVDQVRLVRSAGNSYPLFKRTKGDLGEAVPIFDPDLIDGYKETREIASAFYAGVRNQFDLDQVEATVDAEINRQVDAYYQRLAENARERMSVFTPLDAKENTFADDVVDAFYSPQAVEISENDDDWLNDDEDVQEEDEEKEIDDFVDDDDPEGEKPDFVDDDEERTLRKGDLLQMLDDVPRVIVSGEPGGGKTTCLTYYALQFAKRRIKEGDVAIFVPMGQWRHGGSLESMMQKISGLDNVQLARLIDANRVRLVIDAVNECPDTFRDAAIQNIGFFLQDHLSVPVVISTRNPEELQPLRLPVFHVEPMDENHRRRYLERYLGDLNQADQLLTQIAAMPGGATIAENPMLLRLVVEVYRESPKHRLPDGRAGLYRKSLHSWYKRERAKANKSGLKLPWHATEALALLAEMAFQSRRSGFRDVPIDEVQRIWGDQTEGRLSRLCQGPVICRDSEFLRFRHETFQEYLCAEYLLIEPSALSSVSGSDYSRWGMPMAYAYELMEIDGRVCPEDFWLKAWELNPWMGVAITRKSVGEQIMQEIYPGKLPLVGERPLGSRVGSARVGMVYIGAMINRFMPKVITAAIAGRLWQCWYRKSDAALLYLTSVTSFCRSVWANMERAQIEHLKSLRIKDALVLARNWFSLRNPREIFQQHACESWEKWVSMPDPRVAKKLMDEGIAAPEDFERAKKLWVESVSLEHAMCFCRRRLLDATDVAERIPEWIASASINQAIEMVHLGLCEKSSFTSRINSLISGADIRMLIALVKEGFSSSTDVRDRAVELIDDAAAGEIEELITSGILELTDCRDRLLKIKEKGFPDDAVVLVRLGFADVGEFSSQNAWWFDRATPELLSMLVNNGLASQRDIESRIKHLIATATPNMACKMISNRLAKVSSFYGRIEAWSKHDQYETISEFVEKYGDDEVRKRLRPSIDRFVLNANARSAAGLVCGGFATSADFSCKLPWWKEIENAETWRYFLTCGLVTQREYDEQASLRLAITTACRAIAKNPLLSSEYAGQIGVWARIAPLSCVGLMIKSGLAEAKDFKDRRAKWISMADGDTANCIVKLYRNSVITLAEAAKLALPMVANCSIDDAMRLCREKILQNGEFFERKKAWVANIDVVDAVGLLNLGIISSEDVVPRVPDWVSGATPKVASWLVRAGLVPTDAFHRRIAEWKSSWTLLDAARLINDGVVQLQDVTGDVGIEEYWHKRTVRGRVRLVTADGVEVDIAGSTAILPVAEFKLLQGSNQLSVGQSYDFELIDSGASDFVLSRVLVLKRQAMERVDVDGVYDGVVTKIDAQGAEISIGCLSGYLHIDDMSWARIRNPRMKVREGQRLKVKVLEKYEKRCRLSLGLKQLEPMPRIQANLPSDTRYCQIKPMDSNIAAVQASARMWDGVQNRFSVGRKVHGRIVRVIEYGVFVELDPGIVGFVHVSEFSWVRRIKKVPKGFSVGTEIDVVVLSVDAGKQHLALSIRCAMPDPWSKAQDLFPVGMKLNGKIINLVQYGAFVELSNGMSGLLHISDLTIAGKSLKDFCVGQKIEVVIKSVDVKGRRISLSFGKVGI